MPSLRKRTRPPSDRCRTQTRGFHVTRPVHNPCVVKDATHGTISAQYEYGPFGEVIRMTGAMAKLNPFRFSTKYQDNETGLLYYGYRYYNASTGRWLSRAPFGEKGGLNLYGFVGNNPTDRYQRLHRTAVFVTPFADPLWSLDMALAAVYYWKTSHGDSAQFTQRAQLFTAVGYGGSYEAMLAVGPPVEQIGCDPKQSSPCGLRSFTWRWYPNKLFPGE